MFFRESVGTRFTKTKRELWHKQNGKCARCGKSFEGMGVKPRLHHIAKTNRIESLELLCPNCNSRAHKRKTRTGSGSREKERVLVKRRMDACARETSRKKKTMESGEWPSFLKFSIIWKIFFSTQFKP